jgi:hypothetical protein
VLFGVVDIVVTTAVLRDYGRPVQMFINGFTVAVSAPGSAVADSFRVVCAGVVVNASWSDCLDRRSPPGGTNTFGWKSTDVVVTQSELPAAELRKAARHCATVLAKLR